MNSKLNTIGLFEAKTNLSALVSQVQNGSIFVIAKRGKPIAKLEPYDHNQHKNMRDSLEQLHAIRSTIDCSINIKEYINEGRRY